MYCVQINLSSHCCFPIKFASCHQVFTSTQHGQKLSMCSVSHQFPVYPLNPISLLVNSGATVFFLPNVADAHNYLISSPPSYHLPSLGSLLMLQSSCTALRFSLCDLWEKNSAIMEVATCAMRTFSKLPTKYRVTLF